MMTEKAMLCVRALRICHSNEDCRDCEFVESDRNEKSCVNVLFEDAADLIQSLSEQLEAAQPKWISVEERLPEEGDKVLVYFDGVIATSEIVMFDMITKAPMWSYTGAGGDPTHWMPLPEPPKEAT